MKVYRDSILVVTVTGSGIDPTHQYHIFWYAVGLASPGLHHLSSCEVQRPHFWRSLQIDHRIDYEAGTRDKHDYIDSFKLQYLQFIVPLRIQWVVVKFDQYEWIGMLDPSCRSVGLVVKNEAYSASLYLDHHVLLAWWGGIVKQNPTPKMVNHHMLKWAMLQGNHDSMMCSYLLYDLFSFCLEQDIK